MEDLWPVSSESKKCPARLWIEKIPLLVTLGVLLFPVILRGQTPLDEAIGLYQKGQYQEALEKFRTLLAEENNYEPNVLYYLGKLEPDADKSLEYRRKFLSLYDQHPMADEVLYQVAQYNFALGYYLTAAKDYQRLLRAYPKSDLAAEGLYWLASSKLAIGAADSAKFYFQRLMDQYVSSPMLSWAELGLVDAYFLLQDFPQALARCRAFLDTHPRSSLLPMALFRLAEIHEALEQREQAKEVFEQLVNEYPKTYQGEQARSQLTEWGWAGKQQEKLEVEPGKYTVQVGAFSERANAINLQNQLHSAGYQVEVVKKAGRHRSLYLVWVGSYESRQEAERQAQLLEKQRGLPYQIIRK
jgi:TolA-binding protein